MEKNNGHKHIILPVDKITCQGCVNFIEKNVSDVEGVSSVRANLADSSVNIEYDPAQVRVSGLKQRLDSINYSVPTSSADFRIEGMHCASCVSRIEKHLAETEGISDVRVNLADQSAHVEFIKPVADIKLILKKIEETGYHAKHSGEDPVGQEQEDQYHKNLSFNLKLALPLAILIFMISHLEMLGLGFIDRRISFIILFVLTVPVQFYCGRQFYAGFWKSLKNFNASMDTLIVIGTSAAFLYSFMATFFPSLLVESNQNVAVYYDTAAIIITLILLGRVMESRARNAATSEIEKLVKLEGKKATVIRDGQEIEIDKSEVIKGDVIVIKPGDKLPVDGIVEEGSSAVDESMLTGEPLPREISPGAKVYAGSINQAGYFKFRASAVGSATVIGQIIDSVRNIIASRAPVQRLADKVASIFVPVVMGLALIAFAVWMIVPAESSVTFALMIFIAVLIIACPCALGLATPTAIMVGSARGAREGVLIKSAEILEKVQHIDTVVFDKTGTLSEGKPYVDSFRNFGSKAEEPLMQIAASLEKASNHPLADAVLRYTAEKEIEPLEVFEFENVPGRGLRGKIDGSQIHLGNLAFMKEQEVNLRQAGDEINDLVSDGRTILLLSIDFNLEAMLTISDRIKPEAEDVIQALKKSGRRVWLLSGDNKASAERVGKQLEIDKVIAEVLPNEKSEHVKSFRAAGHSVAMVGDGINDAPALAAADIGIALGSGEDIARSFSDITLVRSDLHGVVKALTLSERTLATIKQNLLWAFGYNIIAIPLAAGVLYPVAGILLSPVVASAAMAISSIFVIGNSLRLRKLQL